MNHDASRVPIEELLAQSAWVRRLAASLVSDPATADDLVQETWLAAMRRPPRGDRPVRPWLYRVLHNVARQFRRSERRRANREAAARSETALPSPDELVERLEIERLLADLVVGLDEPYRSTVILRYREGLTATEIGARLGIPPGTVRSRLKVALDQLRARLDGQHGGDRGAWCAVFLPLLGKPAGTGVALTLGEGMLAMTALAKVGVGMLTLVLALLLVARLTDTWPMSHPTASRGSPGVAESTVAAPGAETRSSGASSAVAEPSSGAREASVETSNSDLDQELHGRVVGLHGEPIARAAIEVSRDLGREYGMLDLDTWRETPVVAKTASDESGTFRVRLPRGRPFDLRVCAAGFASETIPNRYAGESVLVRLHVGAVVLGRISRVSDGMPLRARVRLLTRTLCLPALEAAGDATGAYRMDGAPPGSYFLEVGPEDAAPPPWIPLDLKEGEVLQKDIVLAPGFAVTGKVTDSMTGRPIAGATVGAGWTFGQAVTTNAAGDYVLRGLSTLGGEVVHARAPGYGRSEKPVEGKDGVRVTVDFALTPGSRAIGRVVGPDGDAIAGAYVAAVASDTSDPQRIDWISTRSDAGGAFELRSLRTDLRHALVVMKEGLGRVVYDFPPTMANEMNIDFGDIVLRSMGEIGGTVSDEAGNGLADVQVRINGENADRFRFSGAGEPIAPEYLSGRDGRTDDQGRFRFADLAVGEYTIRAHVTGRPDKATVSVTLASAEVRDGLALVIPSGLSIDGKVTDGHGNALPATRVDLETGEGKRCRDVIATMIAGDDGTFHFSGLASGRYTLVAGRRSMRGDPNEDRVAQVTRTGIEAGRADVVLAIPIAVWIEGTVLDEEGRPTAKVLVEVFDPEGTRVDEKITDDDGRFRIEVAEGSLARLEARRSDKYIASTNGVDMYWGDADVTARGVTAGTRDLVLRLPARR